MAIENITQEKCIGCEQCFQTCYGDVPKKLYLHEHPLDIQNLGDQNDDQNAHEQNSQ